MTDIGDNKPRTVRLERRTPFNPPAGLSSGTTSRDARRFRWCMHGLSGVQHDFWLVCTIVAVARVLSGEGDSGSRGKMFDLSRLAPQQIRLFSEKQVPLWQPSPVLARPPGIQTFPNAHIAKTPRMLVAKVGTKAPAARTNKDHGTNAFHGRLSHMRQLSYHPCAAS